MLEAAGDDDLLLEELARHLSRRGLREPALLAVEVGQPLLPFVSQLLYIAQPALSMVWPAKRVGRVAGLLEKPGIGEQLVAYLEVNEGNG